jgi:dihydrofolate reductase
MGNLVITEYVSLDGVIEAPGGGEDFARAGWTFAIDRGPEGDAFKLDETRRTSALVFGRTTYEGMAAAWPNMTGEFADLFNGLPKFVVSSTVTEPAWQPTEVLSGDLRAGFTRLKERFDGDIVVHGSARLVQELVRLDLVDELRLMVFPIVIGAGKRLFDGTDDVRRFQLDSSAVVGDGVVILRYTSARG